MARLHAFDQIAPILLFKRVDQIHRRLVYRQNIKGRDDPDIRRHDRRRRATFAVARDRHVTQHVDIRDLVPEMIDRRFRRLRHSLHELFFRNAPHIIRAGSRMDHLFADPTIRATDPDILIRAAKAAHDVSLEVRQRQHRVVIQKVLTDRHFLEPLPTLHGQSRRSFRVHDIDGTKSPPVHLQRLAMLLRREAIPFVVRVRFDDRRLGQLRPHQRLDPVARNDIGPVLLPRVELDSDLPDHLRAHALVDLLEPFRRQIAREIDDRLVTRPLFVRRATVSADSRNYFLIAHVKSPFGFSKFYPILRASQFSPQIPSHVVKILQNPKKKIPFFPEPP